MQRARRLARSRAGGPGLNDAVLVFVIPVPLIFAPVVVVGQFGLRIFDGTLLRAQFLAEADSAGRADFHALAAGDALFRIDFGNVRRTGHIGRIEQLGGAQRVADADRAVADAEDLLFAVDIRDLVDVAAFFRLLQDIHGFVVSDVVTHAGLAAVIGEIAHADAPVLFDVTGALAADALLLAAAADAHADLAFVFLQPVGQVFDIEGFALRGDRFLHGDDVHADAGAAGRHHMRDARQGQVSHTLEEVRDLRGGGRDLRTHHHDLGAAGHEHVEHPAHLMVRILAVQILLVEFHKGGLAQRFQGHFESFVVVAGQLLELRERLGLALAHQQGGIEAIGLHVLAVASDDVLQAAVDAPILGSVRGDLFQPKQNFFAVGDDLAKLGDLLVACHGFAHKGFPFYVSEI